MLENVSIGERLHTIIRDDILSGRYAPGERLMFDKIAAENNVSMTPIKEAFLRLEKESLVETFPRRGTFVKKFTNEEITGYYQIRFASERLAVELICHRGLSPEYEQKMLAVCDQLDRHALHEEPKKCVADDIAFHGLLIEASGNKQLYALVKSLPITNLFNISKDKSSEYMEYSPVYQKEHRKIIQLLKEKNEQEVVELLKTHISFLHQQEHIEE